MGLSEVLKRDFVYWDVAKYGAVIEKDTMKPEWAYFELRKGGFDWMVTEHYKDANLCLDFSYMADTPKQEVAMRRIAFFDKYKGNWTKYAVTIPKKQFEEVIKQYYLGD